MAQKLINDWRPEVGSLIETIIQAGLSIRRGDNGDGPHFLFPGQIRGTGTPSAALTVMDNRAAFIDELIACDECWLYIFDGRAGNDANTDATKRCTLYLVLGNSPGELICDYSWHKDATPEFCALLDTIAEKHSEAWTGRAQPKRPSPYAHDKE